MQVKFQYISTHFLLLANAIGGTSPVIEFFATNAPCAMTTMGGSDFFLLRIPLRTRRPLALARPWDPWSFFDFLPEGYLTPRLANNRFNHDQGTFACGGTCLVGVRTAVPRCSEENICSY